MATAAVIGPLLLGLAAALSLLWPGGGGPAGLLPPQSLVFALPALHLLWCVAATGRPGAGAATVAVLPGLLAAAVLSPAGWSTLPGVIAAGVAGGAWWATTHRLERRQGGAQRPHWVAAGAALVVAPPLLGALWAGAGLGAATLAPHLSPVSIVAPALWSAVPLALAAAAAWWLGRPRAAA